MKRIKTFEQMYSDPDIEAELGNIDREDDITPEELKELLDDLLTSDNIDDITKGLVKVKFKYDLNNPVLKDIYWDSVKKWHELTNTLGLPSEKLARL